MRAIHFKEANKIYTKPEGMTDEECYSISAYEGKFDDGTPFVVTVWQPSKEDIDAINAGRPVCLRFIGGGLPPHSLYTTNEKGESNE